MRQNVTSKDLNDSMTIRHMCAWYGIRPPLKISCTTLSITKGSRYLVRKTASRSNACIPRFSQSSAMKFVETTEESGIARGGIHPMIVRATNDGRVSARFKAQLLKWIDHLKALDRNNARQQSTFQTLIICSSLYRVCTSACRGAYRETTCSIRIIYYGKMLKGRNNFTDIL